MCQVGDLVIYGGSNCVCRITDITGLDFPDIDRDRLYYVLKPLRQDCVIYCPADNTDMLMRRVISREDAEALIDMIPGIKAEIYQGQEFKQIAEHYESIIKTRDCAKLIELTMSLYSKKHFLLDNNRKFGAQEDMFMKRAEEMLFGELSAALGIPRESVPSYIAARIERRK
jgi:CarD family transcriptional regulator